MMDVEAFTQALGYGPTGDDLERVNCPRVGEEGHRHCGWCGLCNEPNFYCRCRTFAEIDFTATYEHGGPGNRA